jgi:hypothetical protein
MQPPKPFTTSLVKVKELSLREELVELTVDPVGGVLTIKYIRSSLAAKMQEEVIPLFDITDVCVDLSIARTEST